MHRSGEYSERGFKMGKTAIVFSGQGAQYPGMGKSLYENSESAKSLYDYAETLRPGTLEQSFRGSEEELKLTKNTQPCLYLADICAALALRENGIEADAVAGFSLGELAALAYAGAYTPEKGFEIIIKRAEFMQAAAEENDTAMAAVLKTDSKTVEGICAELREKGESIYPVNYNSPAQTVVAGSKEALALFKEKAKENSARVIDLAVGAAFHSPYMNGAAGKFAAYLTNIEFSTPEIPVYANYTASPYFGETVDTLKMQMNNPVRWCDTINEMGAEGYTDFIEAGVGKTLCGLIKKILPEANVYQAEDYESVCAAAKAVKEHA